MRTESRELLSSVNGAWRASVRVTEALGGQRWLCVQDDTSLSWTVIEPGEIVRCKPTGCSEWALAGSCEEALRVELELDDGWRGTGETAAGAWLAWVPALNRSTVVRSRFTDAELVREVRDVSIPFAGTQRVSTPGAPVDPSRLAGALARRAQAFGGRSIAHPGGFRSTLLTVRGGSSAEVFDVAAMLDGPHPEVSLIEFLDAFLERLAAAVPTVPPGLEPCVEIDYRAIRLWYASEIGPDVALEEIPLSEIVAV